MQAHNEADGALIVTYDSTSFTKWLVGIAVILIGTAAYDYFFGSHSTERVLGLLAGAGTCALTGVALLEKVRFRFDPTQEVITWERRWGIRRRSGAARFHDVDRVLVEVPIGDEGVPSRRICLRMKDGSLLPITVGYRPDVDGGIVKTANMIRGILGHDAPLTARESAQDLVNDGQIVAAVRLLVEQEGLSLAEAKQRVDSMKKGASPHA